MRMTKIRQDALRHKLKESRSRLMEVFPFFGILSMYLKYVAVDNIRNMSTNGKCVFFNADFVSKLYPNEMDFMLCHQIMHIISGDIWRGRAMAGDDFHRACDIHNNAQLRESGWDMNSFSHLGKVQHEIPLYDLRGEELTPLEIFRILPYRLSMLDERTRKRYMTDSDFYWDYKNSGDIDGIIILDIPKMTKYVDGRKEKSRHKGRKTKGFSIDEVDGEGLNDFWAEKSRKALAMAQGKDRGIGSVPGGIKREIEKDKKSTVDWRKELNEFLQEEVEDYSFAPPDRRYAETELFLPDFNEKDCVPRDLLFMADTSGSVSREDLSTVFAEICGAIEQFKGKLNGRLGFFDTEVTAPVPFESVQDVVSIAPHGGGGTNFHIIFKHIREQLNEFLPAMIVIFTDGYASFPEEEAAMNIPVLWLISNAHITPPWGKVGRVITQNEISEEEKREIRKG